MAWAAGPLARMAMNWLQDSHRHSSLGSMGWTRLGLPALGILALIAYNVLRRWQVLRVARFESTVMRALQERIQRHLFRIPMQTLQTHYRGEVGQWLGQDVFAVRLFVHQGLSNLLHIVLLALFLGALLLRLDVMLALLVFAVFPFLALSMAWHARRLRRFMLRGFALQSQVSGRFANALRIIPLIRAYNAQDCFEQGFGRAFERLQKVHIQRAQVGVKLGMLTDVVLAISLVAVLGVGLYRFHYARISFETLASFIAALGFLARPLQSIGGTLQTTMAAWAALDRINALIKLPVEQEYEHPDVLLATQTQQGNPKARESQNIVLHLQNVSFAYGQQALLHNLNITLRGGESWVLVGPSGEGKTTLLLLLLGLLKPSAGSIHLGELRHPPSGVSAEWRRQLAWMPQTPMLRVGTIADNVVFNRSAPSDLSSVITACRQACIHDFVMSLPQGYQTQVQTDGTNLSVGQQQRLSLARAFYADAPILLLDEPTASIDSENEEQILQSIRHQAIALGKLVIVTSHRATTVQAMQYRVELRDGVFRKQD